MRKNSTNSNYRARWSSIFTGAAIPMNPFRDTEWEIFLLDHEANMPEKSFERLLAGISAVGDQSIIASAREGRNVVKLDPMYSSVLGLDDPDIWYPELYLFGMSAEWGMVCTIEDFSYLSGTSRFMDAYAESAGGRPELMREFLDLASAPAGFEREVLEKLLTLVGWTCTEEKG